MTAIAWTENDPVVLSKAISKFMKDNADIYTFKTGVVDGKLVDLTQLTTIANLPSKEELISKLLCVINAQAQRLVTVINAVPRDLAVVIKQIGDRRPCGRHAAARQRKPARARQKLLRRPKQTKLRRSRRPRKRQKPLADASKLQPKRGDEPLPRQPRPKRKRRAEAAPAANEAMPPAEDD